MSNEWSDPGAWVDNYFLWRNYSPDLQKRIEEWRPMDRLCLQNIMEVEIMTNRKCVLTNYPSFPKEEELLYDHTAKEPCNCKYLCDFCKKVWPVSAIKYIRIRALSYKYCENTERFACEKCSNTCDYCVETYRQIVVENYPPDIKEPE